MLLGHLFRPMSAPPRGAMQQAAKRAKANGGVSNKGFGYFLQQHFAGNAKQQLLRLVRERGLVEDAVFEEAVAKAGARGLVS